jgi:hypothetical protein
VRFQVMTVFMELTCEIQPLGPPVIHITVYHGAAVKGLARLELLKGETEARGGSWVWRGGPRVPASGRHLA